MLNPVDKAAERKAALAFKRSRNGASEEVARQKDADSDEVARV